jgi:hypothetical protein
LKDVFQIFASFFQKSDNLFFPRTLPGVKSKAPGISGMMMIAMGSAENSAGIEKQRPF